MHIKGLLRGLGSDSSFSKRAAAEDKRADAAARTKTQPPVKSRTTTPPLAIASWTDAQARMGDVHETRRHLRCSASPRRRSTRGHRRRRHCVGFPERSGPSAPVRSRPSRPSAPLRLQPSASLRSRSSRSFIRGSAPVREEVRSVGPASRPRVEEDMPGT